VKMRQTLSSSSCQLAGLCGKIVDAFRATRFALPLLLKPEKAKNANADRISEKACIGAFSLSGSR
jgi:hypothetical protein